MAIYRFASPEQIRADEVSRLEGMIRALTPKPRTIIVTISPSAPGRRVPLPAAPNPGKPATPEEIRKAKPPGPMRMIHVDKIHKRRFSQK